MTYIHNIGNHKKPTRNARGTEQQFLIGERNKSIGFTIILQYAHGASLPFHAEWAHFSEHSYMCHAKRDKSCTNGDFTVVQYLVFE
jgi:hypothetical protein